MKKTGIFIKTIAMVLAVFLAVPVQMVSAAAAKVEIGHSPPDDEYLPGFRIELDATIADEGGLLATRCYFKAKNDKVFTFVNMRRMQGDQYRAVLPSPWVNSEYIDYLFITVSAAKVVTRTQMYRIEEEETDEAAEWKDAGEVREIRIDKAQEVVEEYETLRRRIREKYAEERPAYQIDPQGTIMVSTELDSPLALTGFYDSLNVFKVPMASRFGVLTEDLYTAQQIAEAGGVPAVASATGGTSGGLIAGSGGSSIGTIIAGTLLVGALVGGGIALGNSSSDDDSSGSTGGPVDVGAAAEANFYGTYSNKDPDRSTNSWRGVTTLSQGGNGSWEEWIGGQHNSGSLSWSWNQGSRRMVIDYHTGAIFSGTVSGTTYNFTLSGRWSSGQSGQLIFTRQ